MHLYYFFTAVGVFCRLHSGFTTCVEMNVYNFAMGMDVVTTFRVCFVSSTPHGTVHLMQSYGKIKKNRAESDSNGRVGGSLLFLSHSGLTCEAEKLIPQGFGQSFRRTLLLIAKRSSVWIGNGAGQFYKPSYVPLTKDCAKCCSQKHDCIQHLPPLMAARMNES